MNKKEAKEMHWLLLTFAGLFHKKFLLNLRKRSRFEPRVKKNQAKIINMLYQHDGLTSTEVGKMLDIEKGSLTTILDQLEEMGFIIRTVDTNDRRKILLSLTALGREQMEQTMNVYTDTLIDLFKDVNSEEMNKFLNSLRYVVDFMKRI